MSWLPPILASQLSADFGPAGVAHRGTSGLFCWPTVCSVWLHLPGTCRQWRRHGATIGGRGPFEVDFFHATPVGIMLTVENIAGTGPPSPAVTPPMRIDKCTGHAGLRELCFGGSYQLCSPPASDQSPCDRDRLTAVGPPG